MSGQNTFHWVDYLIFVLVLVVSASIGIFYAWKDKKKQTTANFLLGGRKMALLPVTLSLMATFLSAILVLGVPTEVFYNGTMYWLISFSNLITFPVAAHAFLPVFHDLGLTSAYEYLERRFNAAVRVIGSIVFQLQMILYMAVALYAPAIALNQVMGIDILVSILVIGAVCTFYTAIGGLKAVMWTDAFQMAIVFAGVMAVAIKGTTELGGFQAVWQIARNGSKIQADNFDPNPLVRHTFWTLVFGGFMTSMTIYSSNQAMIQRYLSMATLRRAQTALYLQLPASIIFTSLLVYTGLVLYARYSDDDPLQQCLITKRDQLIPWLVMDVLGNLHGFPGLLVACIFSASLSTVSSGVNALALVFLTDIAKPLYRFKTGKRLSERASTILSKILALSFGIATIGLAFLAQFFGSLILQVALSIFGMVGGPLLGLFVSAMFFPIINEWGALVGVISSLAVTSWVAIGSILYRSSQQSAVTCQGTNLFNETVTTISPSFTTVDPSHEILGETNDDSNALALLYQLSYMWYSSLAVLVTVVVALLVSCLTGGTRNKPVNRNLLSPLYNKIASWAATTDTKFVQKSSKARTTADGMEMRNVEQPGSQNGFKAVYQIDRIIEQK